MLALLGQRLAPALAAAGPGACRSITASRAAGDLREWLDPQTTPAESVSYGGCSVALRRRHTEGPGERVCGHFATAGRSAGSGARATTVHIGRSACAVMQTGGPPYVAGWLG